MTAEAVSSDEAWGGGAGGFAQSYILHPVTLGDITSKTLR